MGIAIAGLEGRRLAAAIAASLQKGLREHACV